jgi:hypothetical protein
MDAVQRRLSFQDDDGDGISTGIHAYFSIDAELLSCAGWYRRHSRNESIWECAVVRIASTMTI